MAALLSAENLRSCASNASCEPASNVCALFPIFATCSATMQNTPCAFFVRYGLSPIVVLLQSTLVTVNSNLPSRTGVPSPADFAFGAVVEAGACDEDCDCSGGRRNPDVSAGEFGEDVEGAAAVLGRGR